MHENDQGTGKPNPLLNFVDIVFTVNEAPISKL